MGKLVLSLIMLSILFLIPVIVQNAFAITGFGTDNLHFDTGSSPPRFLALDTASPDIIISIDANTGIGSVVTTLMDSGGTPVSINGCALAKNPDDGKWYTVARTTSSMHLFEVDVTSGLITDIGDLNQNAIVASLHICALSFEGTPAKLIAHDSVNSKHLLIDLSTGEATDLGPTTFISGIAGLATSRTSVDTATSPTDATVFTHPSGTVFGVYQDKTDKKDYLIWVDVTTGKANKIVEIIGGVQFRGVAFGPNGNFFVIENPSQTLSTINMITGVKTNVGVVLSLGSSSSHEDPTIGKTSWGLQVVENGICIDITCWTVTADYHQDFELVEMLSDSSHTISTTVFCQNGLAKCNYVAFGVSPYGTNINDSVWKVILEKDHTEKWTMTVIDPDGYLGDVTTTTQIVNDEKNLSASMTALFKKPTPGMILNVEVRDSNGGYRDFKFNDGIEIVDAYAYPVIETSYEEPLEIEPLCLNENPNKRYTCAFDMVKKWSIKNAKKALFEIK